MFLAVTGSFHPFHGVMHMHSSATSELARTQTSTGQERIDGQDKTAATAWFNDLTVSEWRTLVPVFDRNFEKMDEMAIRTILHKTTVLSDAGKAWIHDQMKEIRELGERHQKDNVFAD